MVKALRSIAYEPILTWSLPSTTYYPIMLTQRYYIKSCQNLCVLEQLSNFRSGAEIRISLPSLS